MDDNTVEVVAVGEVPDQEDKYGTYSGRDMDDNDHDFYPYTTTLGWSGCPIRAFALTCRVCNITGCSHIHYLKIQKTIFLNESLRKCKNDKGNFYC